jgi:uncharacterized coiled-coil protein SlyX
MIRIKALALLIISTMLLSQLSILLHAQATPEVYVTPNSGHGVDEEPIIVSGCNFRPNSIISKIELYNTLTGQIYEFSVDEPTDESGCFGPVDLKGYLLTNMSYGTYYVIVYETPIEQPEPLVVTDTIAFNESRLLSIDASIVLGTPATITAEFYVEGLFAFNGYARSYSDDVTTTIGVIFTGEDERSYRLNAWRVNITQVDSPILFQLVDLETNSIVFSEEVAPEEVNGIFVATLTFDLGDRLREDLPNNMALFTSAEDYIMLELYYGGRHVEILYAMLNITYYNEETDTYWEYLYEYPGNLPVYPEEGLVYVEEYLGEDADIMWSSAFEWDAVSEDAVFMVNATYLDRILYFEDLYTITPLLLIDGMLAEHGGTYDLGILTAGDILTLTVYGSTPYSPVTVIVDGSLTLYNGLTGKDGNLTITIQIPYLMPGEEHLITVEFQYDSNVYRAYIIYTQYWYAYYQLINPVTGEYLTENRASASYYNETVVAYLNGEPFDYVGDLIEVYAEGLLPGSEVIIRFKGLSDFDVCSGEANDDGVLSLTCTIASVPKDNYVVKLVVIDDIIIEVSIPWFNGVEYVYEPLEIYPKILVLKIGSDEVPVIVGNSVVRVVGTGFPANSNGFLILINGTDALASTNLHSLMLWSTNEYGILTSVFGAVPGLTIPILEPGVYELRLARDRVVSEPSYVFVVNSLSEVATKEDIDNLMSNTTDLVNSLREDLYSVEDSLSAQLLNIYGSLSGIQDVLTSIYSEMVTKEDLTTALNTVLAEINSSKTELLITLLDQLSSIFSSIDGLYVRLDEIELVIYGVSEDITDMLLALQESLNEAILKLDTIIENMATAEDLAVVYEGISTSLESVHDSIISRIDLLETNVTNRINEAESNIIANLESLRNDLLDAISETNSTIISGIDAVINRIDLLETNVTSEISLLRDEVASSIERLAGLVNESTNMIMVKLNELTTKDDLLNAVEDLTARIGEVESSVSGQVSSLGDTLLEVNTTLTSSISAVESRVASIEDRIASLETGVSELSEMISEVGINLGSVNEHLSDKIDALESSISDKITRAKDEVMASVSGNLSIITEKVENTAGVASNAFTFSLLATIFAIITMIIAILVLIQLRKF